MMSKMAQRYFYLRVLRLRVIKICFFPYGLLTSGKYTLSNPCVVNDQSAAVDRRRGSFLPGSVGPDRPGDHRPGAGYQPPGSRIPCGSSTCTCSASTHPNSPLPQLRAPGAGRLDSLPLLRPCAEQLSFPPCNPAAC